MKSLLLLLHAHLTKSKDRFKYFSSVIITANFHEKATRFFQEKRIIDPNCIMERVLSDPKAFDRLTRLIMGDIISQKTTFTAEFTKFCAEVPGWESSLLSLNRLLTATNTLESASTTPSIYKLSSTLDPSRPFSSSAGEHVFWMRFEDRPEFKQNSINEMLVIRKQSSGVCYLHASIVLEHYLIALGTNGRNRGMIDIGSYIATTLGATDLEGFLFSGHSGNAQRTLIRLCGLSEDDHSPVTLPDPHRLKAAFDLMCADIYNNVRYKPYLVSNFKVYNHFMAEGQYSYSMADISTAEERQTHSTTALSAHSMLLIGARKDAHGQYYFLLQNWWDSKYFIEVTAEYLYYCRANMMYVTKDINSRRADLSVYTYVSPYAETTVDDGGDEVLELKRNRSEL